MGKVYNLSKSEESNKLVLAHFAKFQELRKQYLESPKDSALCGFIIVNSRAERNETVMVHASQFGDMECQINTVIVALCRTTESLTLDKQISVSKQLSNIFAKRAATLEQKRKIQNE